MTLLRTLTHEELLRHAEGGRDDLTTTALELEFMNRFNGLIDDAAHGAAMLNLLDEYGFELDDLGDYLAAIRDEPSIGSAAQLAADLKLAKRFRTLADDGLFDQLYEMTKE